MNLERSQKVKLMQKLLYQKEKLNYSPVNKIEMKKFNTIT